MSRYDSSGDPYCYPGTEILRNRFNIRDPDKLADVDPRRRNRMTTDPAR